MRFFEKIVKRAKPLFVGKWGCRLFFLMMFAFFIMALFPFRWLPPRDCVNGAKRTAFGLGFYSAGKAQTIQSPEWLKTVRENRDFEIELTIRSLTHDQLGRGMFFYLAESDFRVNFYLCQHERDLGLGFYPGQFAYDSCCWFDFKNVVHIGDWQTIRICIDGEHFVAMLDDRVLLAREIPADYLDRWRDDAHLVLGNDVGGNAPWIGEISEVTVRSGSSEIDYSRSRALTLPTTYKSVRLTWPWHSLYHFPRTRFDFRLWLPDYLLNFLCFVPLGFLAAWL